MAPRSPPWESKYSHLASASYLSNLRNNRPARPTGSRPLPSKPVQQDENLPPRSESSLAFRTSRDRFIEDDSKDRKAVHRSSMPTSNSYGSLGSQKGRPLVPTPSSTMNSFNRKVSPPLATTSDIKYRENIARIKEREEAHKLREALTSVKTDEDEGRIHEAAKLEAADLVWKHQHPNRAEVEKTAAYRNPDLSKEFEELTMVKVRTPAPKLESKTNSRSASAESTSSRDGRPKLPWLRRRPKNEQPQTPQKDHETILQKSVRKFSGRRQSSGGSSKSLFKNPEDEIYEEKEEMPTIEESTPIQMPLNTIAGNTLPKGSRPLPEKSMTDPLPATRTTQAPTNPWGRHTETSRALPQTPAKVEEEEQEEEEIRYIDGYEVRSDDIRAATSMRKSDRSPNLPTPTAVSDRPGRPIVSFDKKWHPSLESPRNSKELERVQSHKTSTIPYPVKPVAPVPEITILEHPDSPALQREKTAGTAVPTFSFSVDDPAPPEEPINKANSATPTFNFSVEEPELDTKPTRPLPQISTPQDTTVLPNKPNGRPLPPVTSSRPLPQHTQSAPVRTRPSQSELANRVPWLARTPISTTSAVTCTACTLPISGRIVTASGSSAKSQKARFHPECFSCHKCSEGLEAVAFYPEPEAARLERIQQAMPHLQLDDSEIQAIAHSNEDLHFFCHLDYHELYSPRCHNCKTPIEGAIILALGRHYHADHFFCAECGDPFTAESPFVEHNDYPYCVSCHTKRTSARCRACKAQILNEMTIEALGGKWHDACFVCCECGGDFGDEGRFFVREVELPLTEKQRRKGLAPVVEETAACQACEERRVKNVNLFL